MNTVGLRELTFNNIDQWSLTIKISVILGGSLSIVILGYWLIIKANLEQYTILQSKEVALRADFERKQHQSSNLQAYRNQLQLMKERFTTLLKQLPAKNEMPGLLEEISKTGKRVGLRFELFAPQSEVEQDFYIELPIKISVEGSYMQLALFLSRVAEMNQIVTLHEFRIEGLPSKDKKTVPEDVLRMSITAKIYRYRTS